MEILARAARVIAEGDVLQLSRAHDINLSQDTYLQIIAAKTAELFAAAAESGAVAADAGAVQSAALRSYGLNLGFAFQLSDDALDYGGLTETLGKNAGDDFREGKVTLPLLVAIARTGAAERAFWERVIGRQEQADGDFRRARDLVVGVGALEATLDMAAGYADSAKEALSIFPQSELRDGLEALADFAVHRRA
jgi:octaprenyl-diphosphate synthase